MDKTIILCRIRDAASMISFMNSTLQEEFTDPVGAPDQAGIK